MIDVHKRIESRLEELVKESKAKVEQSSKSESLYYHYNGWTFRISGHWYPTGSMTNWTLQVLDLTDDTAEVTNKALSLLDLEPLTFD